MYCPLCNFDKNSKIGQKNSHEIFKCEDCNFRFVYPRPSFEMLKDFYENYKSTGNYLQKKDKKIARAARRIRRLMKLVPGRKFLDVGCNVGFATEAARQAGFTATGIDLDSVAIGIAATNFPGCAFVGSSVEDFAQSGETFDVVYCSEVIEHVIDIHSFARAVSAMMSDKGVLFLATPDAGHFRVPRNFANWGEVIPPEHISYFDQKSLTRLLEGYGLKLLSMQWHVKPGIRSTWQKVG